MKHAILGAGAVGGLIGTALASLGEEVIVVVRPETLAGYPESLLLERPQGPISAPARAVAALAEPVDVLWIGTKHYNLQPAIAEVHSLSTCVVPLLNGVDHMQVLRAHFGRDRVVPASIAVEAERTAPGRFLQRSLFVRLTIASAGEPLLGAIARRLGDCDITCRFEPNEQTLLWNKLCFLGPLALTTSASGMNKGELFADAGWKNKLITAIAEFCDVANASGAEVDPSYLLAFLNGLQITIRTSMQKDLAAGHEIELEALSGPVIRGGERYGIDVSATKGLVEDIKKKIAER